MKKLLFIMLGTLTLQFSQAQAPNDNIGSGNCLDFDGVDDRVDCPNIASTAQGTLEAWIRPGGTYTGNQIVMIGTSTQGNNTTRNHIGAVHPACGGQWWTLLANGATSQIVCSGQSYNSTNFPIGVWTHLAITYDGSNVNFYKDGDLVNIVVQTVSAAGSAQPFSIGAHASSNDGFYDGGIDEVRIWSIARSQTQIRNNMCKPLQGNEAGLVGYWNMNEGTGNTVTDLTSNNNHGTRQ